MANDFLNFVENIGDYIPGGTAALPYWLSGMLAGKAPAAADLSAVLPYYQQAAATAKSAGDFAADQGNFYGQYYRPAAIAFNERAQGAGGPADLNAAAERNAANYRSAFQARKAAVEHDLRGFNPNSGAAQARRGVLDASYAPGLVDAMNKGRREEQRYGDALRATALGALDKQPNFNGPASIYGALAAGQGALADSAYNRYRQGIADTTKTLKLPFDLEDEKRRRADSENWRRTLENIYTRFPYARNAAFGSDASAPTSSPMSPNYGAATPAEMSRALELDKNAFGDFSAPDATDIF